MATVVYTKIYLLKVAVAVLEEPRGISRTGTKGDVIPTIGLREEMLLRCAWRTYLPQLERFER